MAGDAQVWTEKYRPKSLSEVINQKHVTERLKAWTKSGNIPNMLFAGPAGVGKTTMAVCLARDLFGSHWRENFSEFNASVTPDTPILVRKNGRISRTNFGRLANGYFRGNEKYVKADDLEVLSLDENYRVKFKPVSLISRHRVKNVVNIKYEGGSIRTSLNHSVIVVDREGKLTSKEAGNLRKGDLLITFRDDIAGKPPVLEFEQLEKPMVVWHNSTFRNPKIKTSIKNTELNSDISWLMGMYLAEGCTSIRSSGTSGVVIFTVSHEEREVAERIGGILEDKFGLQYSINKASSGFDRSRMTSIQVRTCNTQFSRFFYNNFYGGMGLRDATTKRVPDFMFSSDFNNKESFLKGYMGDACGEWGSYVRYSSRSLDNLIDIAWLGRISGLDTSLFGTEARIIWKMPSFSWLKTDFVPVEPIIEMIKTKRISKNNPRYALRHQMYSKKCPRISKQAAKALLNSFETTDKIKANILRFIESSLSVVKITGIQKEEYSDYVYDVSVPGTEMFWGGTTPILLHNSDERGIDVVRGRIKDYAMMKPLGADFKIVFLDEADALTPEAQQALRRTIEKFSSVCRFIFSVNFSGRIIEPIQSRCAVFRFHGFSKEHVSEYLDRIVSGEKLHADADAMEAIHEVSEGDLRKATNILQTAAAMGKITREVVYEVVSQAKPGDVAKMLNLAVGGKFAEARKLLLDMLFRQGLSGEDIIREIHKQIFSLDISESGRARLLEKTGEFEFRLNQGGSDDIQLEALLAQFGAAKAKQT
ncbi:MAG: replication factor C small subunit [Candidatus Aenigmarchaeota archaeon]|nr:replication factor C small subunit [Candidatus Aenigmarchaeota archaeon]